MKLVNLTPHVIYVMGENAKTQIKTSGTARCNVVNEEIGEINGIPVRKNSYGEITGLPDPEEGTVYIVSSVIANAVKEKRDDCVIVDQTVRNEQGLIVGCKGFAVL